jgi:hypothetical protein
MSKIAIKWSRTEEGALTDHFTVQTEFNFPKKGLTLENVLANCDGIEELFFEKKYSIEGRKAVLFEHDSVEDAIKNTLQTAIKNLQI